jgi:hypothetical protein
VLDGQIVRVSGVPDAARLPEAGLSDLLSVYVDVPDVPPLSGDYRVENGDIVFAPRYPLGAGMKYRIELRLPSLAPIIRTFETAKADETPTTYVRQVYPTAGVLPENQLKFYIHFSAPMSRGEAYDRVHLLDAAENIVEDAFLELPEELWDQEATRLTIFFDPGRIKTGLVPNLEMGTALETGKAYTLVIDREWRDGENKPLKDRFTKSFSVGPADKKPLSISDFKLTTPRSSGRDPLVVTFPEAVDHALLERQLQVLDVAGAIVPGSVEISQGETQWTFRPQSDWMQGTYGLRIATNLADLAGNMVGRAFEVDVFDKVDQTIQQETQTLSFTVGR